MSSIRPRKEETQVLGMIHLQRLTANKLLEKLPSLWLKRPLDWNFIVEMPEPKLKESIYWFFESFLKKLSWSLKDAGKIRCIEGRKSGNL